MRRDSHFIGTRLTVTIAAVARVELVKSSCFDSC